MNVEAEMAGADALQVIKQLAYGLVMCGVSRGYLNAVQDHGILSRYYDMLRESKLPAWIRKPLGTCPYCMFFWITLISSTVLWQDWFSCLVSVGAYLFFWEVVSND